LKSAHFIKVPQNVIFDKTSRFLWLLLLTNRLNLLKNRKGLRQGLPF